MEMTGGEALAAQLAREGVSTVFGVPGVQLDHAVDGLYRERERIRFVPTRHEQAATYMADGYARSLGRPGVAMVVPGPGVLNAAAGLATAYACSSPVLLLAGQIASSHIGEGLGLLHEIPNQSALVASLTKWTGRAQGPAEIPALVRRAMHHLGAGRPRPVALELPPDVLAARAEITLVEPEDDREQGRLAPEEESVHRLVALLEASERPLLVAGGGALRSGAGAALGALAERLGAPVVVTDNGRGVLSDRHPLCLTSLSGRPLLRQADVVVGVGTRFVTLRGAPLPVDGHLALINADAADLGGVRRPEIALLADARLALGALADAIRGSRRARAPWADLGRLEAEARRAIDAVQPEAAYVAALRDAIPEDGVLVNELTQVGYLARVAYPVYEPGTLIGPGYQGTLGYGFPTALGVQVARPDRAVVSITGDGGFGWTLQELATARRESLPLVTVVFNDGAFGNVRRTQKAEFDGHVLGTDLANPDFVRLAEAFGVAGERVDGPEALGAALRSALSARTPALIEVRVGEMPSPWPLLTGASAADRR